MCTIKSIVNLLIVLLVIACTSTVEKPEPYSTTLVKWTSKNGKIRAKGILINGQKQGLWNEFTDSGDLATQCEYTNDTLNGKCLSYYNSGKLMTDVFYKNGLKDSVWIIYHENGKVNQTGSYKGDKQVGSWSYFYENGTLDKEIIYTMK